VGRCHAEIEPTRSLVGRIKGEIRSPAISFYRLDQPSARFVYTIALTFILSRGRAGRFIRGITRPKIERSSNSIFQLTELTIFDRVPDLPLGSCPRYRPKSDTIMSDILLHEWPKGGARADTTLLALRKRRSWPGPSRPLPGLAQKMLRMNKGFPPIFH
jgi:hypothetical protein